MPAMIDPESGRSISHDSLTKVVGRFRLPIVSRGLRKPVVAISLPNGPLLGLTVLATSNYYTAAPVAHGSGVGPEQFKTDVLQSKSNAVVASGNDVGRLGLHDTWLSGAGIEVFLAELSEDMQLVLRNLHGEVVPQTMVKVDHNSADDIGILLFTSGTSGTKKLVPLSIHSMVCGIAMVIESWGLSPSMRCLNQMPLNHVGGLIRNLFAPICSGGSVICCSAFDANLFWDCVDEFSPSYYYASPTMHQCILDASLDRPDSVQKSQIRLICNAAGGLLPSLAGRLLDTFSVGNASCTILPSYGMTECMPISTPPLDYRLDRTGTSGISVGPEVCILDGSQHALAPCAVGHICVRGAPVFGGYLKADDTIDTSCFNAADWFSTGDMGYLDADGFLYITGRSKEVINRGGELISPFEVEEAVLAAGAIPGSPVYGRISKVLAFSVAHDVLQEVVGIMVVTPDGSLRTCLRDVQEAVRSVLAQVKLPMLLVFSDGGLPTNNNKVLRIRLADRLGLPDISDATPQAERHYTAECPPVNTPLNEPIKCDPLAVDYISLASAVQKLLPHMEAHVRKDETNYYAEAFVAPIAAHPGTPMADHLQDQAIVDQLRPLLHGYERPTRLRHLKTSFARCVNGTVDDAALDMLLFHGSGPRIEHKLSQTETSVAAILSQLLSVPLEDISKSSDFFELGGSSMSAGQLLSKLRKVFQVRLPISALFTNSSLDGLAALVDEKVSATSHDKDQTGATAVQSDLLPGCEETYSSTQPLLLLLQLLPIGVWYPMKRALTWTIFLYVLTSSQNWYTNNSIPGRLLDLVLSMAVARIITKTVAPLVAIACKWILITHVEGLYPMWSPYHTRWWLCQKIISIAGFGVFGVSNTTRVWYYRLLGATIGRNVTINKGAILGEYDLITIGDNAVLERCIVRPFAAERNTSMYLGRVSIGANAVVGLGSLVAPGTQVPEHACIGPNSSSWEMDADEANRDLASSRIQGPHWVLSLFLGIPLQTLTALIGAIPWLCGLAALVAKDPKNDTTDMLREVVIWFASPSRVGYHYLALCLNALLAPACVFLTVCVIKAIFDQAIGVVRPNNGLQSQLERFRSELLRMLMPSPQFHKLADLFGTHYESTSILARLLGARVGKRVYWPGTGPSIQDFALLDIGDDVVFGSRSHLVTSDGSGSDHVRIGKGAMVADRVVLLPGTRLGERTVMGSGALTKRNAHYASGTTWVGSRGNDAICLSADAKPNSPSLGTRTSQYYETPKMPYNMSNSTSTTLIQNVDSETSSVTVVEKFDAEDVKSKGVSITISAVMAELEEKPAEAESSSPFGRAFYHGLAPYRVWNELEIFGYCTLITVCCALYWNISSISAVQIVGHAYKYHTLLSQHFLGDLTLRPIRLYVYFTGLTIAIMAAQTIAVLLFLIGMKWLLLGRRQPGNYDWDKSPYCQRWQLFLKLESLRRHCYGGQGILGLLTGTAWMVAYFRALGLRAGKDCALFAGGRPQMLLTEPDLISLGDRVAVDDASLVGHINTRGKFDLNRLAVGDRSVLRSGSRLLSSARMEEDTCLLEHTLVMAGDVVEAGSTSQGWPAEEFKGNRMPTLTATQVWKKA